MTNIRPIFVDNISNNQNKMRKFHIGINAKMKILNKWFLPLLKGKYFTFDYTISHQDFGKQNEVNVNMNMNIDDV